MGKSWSLKKILISWKSRGFFVCLFFVLRCVKTHKKVKEFSRKKEKNITNFCSESRETLDPLCKAFFFFLKL